MRGTKRRQLQTLHFQDFCDSCAQNKTSEISTTALSGIQGFLRAEQHVGNLSKCIFRNPWTPVCRTKRRKSQKHALLGVLGFLCAEQNVGNLKKSPFRNSGTPVRRTRRRKSQKMDFQDFWDSCAHNKTSEISKT